MAFNNGPRYTNVKTAKELYDSYPATRGVNEYYLLYPDGNPNGKRVLVYCDMTTDGGGWMLVARSHPSTINYGGTNWGWQGGEIGSVQDFTQAYQAGWYTNWHNNTTFTSFLFGNRANINNNSWGPFIYKVSSINYSTFFTSDSEQGYSNSTVQSNTAVYGTTSYPGMQGRVGFTSTGTSNNLYYMRDCCGFSGYGGYPTYMNTVYCGSDDVPYYSGPWCGGSSTDGSGNFLNGVYSSAGGRTYGGTNQYMIFVK